MKDKEALQEIVFMVNDYVNKPYNETEGDLVKKKYTRKNKHKQNTNANR